MEDYQGFFIEESDDELSAEEDIILDIPSEEELDPPIVIFPNGRHISYDRALPAQHVYLGSDLEEVSGRTVHDDNSIQKIPVLILPKVVLIPGQTFPLQIFRPGLIMHMKRLIRTDRTFGIITSGISERPPHISHIGTTAEIRSYGEDLNLFYLNLKAEGRQRFKLIKIESQVEGVHMAFVKILPEIKLGDPGAGIRLGCIDRYQSPSPNCENDNSGQIIKKKNHRLNFSALTGWPEFVYKQYDAKLLMSQINQELKGWDTNLHLKKNLEKSPSEYSFWIAANLPLDDQHRIQLLEFDCAIQRLRFELHFIQKYSRLSCAKCKIPLADRSDIFSMSVEGPQGTFCNPNGYVHETITVRRAKNLVLNGRESREYSWFPGYAWTICECKRCGHHMGWKFTTKENLEPKQFWGLCRSSVKSDWIDDMKVKELSI